MSKIVIFSDLHVHPWREFSDGESRLLDCVSVLTDIRDYCQQHEIKLVLFGGDLFHKRGVVQTRAFNLVVQELANWRTHELRLLCVAGNHDHANREGSVHALQALRDAELIWDCPETVHSSPMPELGVHLSLFSYCDDRDEFRRRVDSVPTNTDPHLAVFHHGFEGARVGSSLEYQVKESIDGSELEGRFTRIFSGHYHTRQPIEGVESATYIGSPLECTRSDRTAATEEADKGFLVYDTADDSVSLVPLTRPHFVRMVEEELDSGTAWEEKADGNYVDLIYEDIDPRVAEAQLIDAGAEGVKLIPVARPKAAKNRLEVDASLDASTLLDRYLEYRSEDIGAKNLVRERLHRLGVTLLSTD